MNFFEHQDQARQNTTRLLGLFVLAIAFMIAALYFATVFGILLLALQNSATWAGQNPIFTLWQPGLLFLCTLAVLTTVGLGSLWKIQTLRQGGHAVAGALGGRPIAPDTQHPQEQLLLNVVEEMAIASGVSVPAVYLLDRELGINAFAAGYGSNDAVIGVTRGCVEQLSRDQLQGVIAHEFSHILNGDMRLNIRLIGVLHGILIIYLIGRVVLESAGRSRGGKDRGLFVAIGLTLILAGGMGLICGRLIKSAVSRQREFLADASAVQFTRNPDGLREALLNIAGYAHSSHVVSPRAEEASHLFFGNAFSRAFFDPFATHPPLEERVRRLGQCAAQVMPLPQAVTSPVSPNRSLDFVTAGGAVMGLQGTAAPQHPQNSQIQVAPERVIERVGTTDPQHLAFARSLLAKLPDPIREAIKHPTGSMAIVYGLLLDSNEAVRDRQIALLQKSVSPEIIDALQQLSPSLQKLPVRARLPLLDLTIPALRTITKPECAQFFNQVKELARADGRLSLSEYVLQIVLQRRLRPSFQPAAKSQIEYSTVDQIWPDCVTLLSALAQVGQNTPDAVVYALRSGLFRLPEASKRSLPTEPAKCGLYDVGQSLNRLELAVPRLKQVIVDACAHTVLMDNHVTLEEAELLRAIVIALDCPLPPFLDAVRYGNG